jgi:hypothetical protein
MSQDPNSFFAPAFFLGTAGLVVKVWLDLRKQALEIANAVGTKNKELAAEIEEMKLTIERRDDRIVDLEREKFALLKENYDLRHKP